MYEEKKGKKAADANNGSTRFTLGALLVPVTRNGTGTHKLNEKMFISSMRKEGV
jgi:hypothetical protein